MSDQPEVSPAVLSATVSALGGVIVNLFVFHATQAREQERGRALDAIARVARDAANIAEFKHGTAADTAAMKQALRFVLGQCEELARGNLDLDRDRDKPRH